MPKGIGRIFFYSRGDESKNTRLWKLHVNCKGKYMYKNELGAKSFGQYRAKSSIQYGVLYRAFHIPVSSMTTTNSRSAWTAGSTSLRSLTLRWRAPQSSSPPSRRSKKWEESGPGSSSKSSPFLQGSRQKRSPPA